jgi:hypothetical protein
MFRSLFELDLEAVPKEFGAYVVARPARDDPVFLERSVGGLWKGADRTESREELARRWVKGASIMYIGAAGLDPRNKTHLRGRLSSLQKYGHGLPVPHAGGHRLWQLRDHQDLLVGWKATPGVPGKKLEGDLLAVFYDEWHCLPFANGRF